MQVSPFKTAVNFGAMCGLSCFAFFMLLYWIGANPLGPGSWLGVWIIPLFVILSTRYHRNVEQAGFITYREAYSVGFFTAASGALLFSLILYIFGMLGDPSFVDDYKMQMLSDLETQEGTMRSLIGDRMYEQSMDEIKNTTLTKLAVSDFFNKTAGGAIFSLISAAFLKRKKSDMA